MMRTSIVREYKIGFADTLSGVSATAFPAFKVSAQKGLF
ncbi:MAG: hypothetical protein ACJAX3_002895 [Patiriisocius sp.]|jgi:hypothetical protein